MTSKIELVVVGRVLVLHFSETVIVRERDYGSLVVLRLLLAVALLSPCRVPDTTDNTSHQLHVVATSGLNKCCDNLDHNSRKSEF
jgi:hypothetical protein